MRRPPGGMQELLPHRVTQHIPEAGVSNPDEAHDDAWQDAEWDLNGARVAANERGVTRWITEGNLRDTTVDTCRPARKQERASQGNLARENNAMGGKLSPDKG